MMKSSEFDNKKLEEMNIFLDRIYQISNSIPVNGDVVYHELCKYSLKPSDLENEFGNSKIVNFEPLKEYYKSRKNLSVVQHDYRKYFLCFDSIPYVRSPKYLKLYIPIDFKHLEESSKRIFDFIAQLGIKHTSKIASEIRSDNVVVRLPYNDDCFKIAKLIINFINSNNDIVSGLNSTNPFVPTIGGIGYMIESGISYNHEISILIAKYINDLKNGFKRGSKPNVDDFYNYYIKNAKIIDSYFHKDVSDEVKSTFLDAISNDKLFYRYVKESDIVNISDDVKGNVGKNNDVYSNNPMSRIDENSSERMHRDEFSNKKLFLDAIKATYDKYGIKQVRGAILKIIEEDNFESITNGSFTEMYRDKLEKRVSGKVIFEYIKSTVDIMDKDFSNYLYRDNLVIIDRFLSLVLYNELVDDFKQCCMVTYQKSGKYGKEQLCFAIDKKIHDDNPMGFSRFPKNGDKSVNYRNIINGYTPQNIIMAMESLLGYYGIDKNSSNIHNLISSYGDLITDLSQIESKSK